MLEVNKKKKLETRSPRSLVCVVYLKDGTLFV